MKIKLLSFVLAAVSLPAAQFQVTVDTTSLSAQSGTVDIQFNPGSFPDTYESGTATITAFDLGAGSLGSINSGPDGGVSGSLPGPLVIVNSDFMNGVVYNIVSFGNSLTFLLDLSGDAYTAADQTILTSFNLTLSGTGSITAYAELIGNSQIDTTPSSPGVAFDEVGGVPEPSTLALVAMGLVSAFDFSRRKLGSA